MYLTYGCLAVSGEKIMRCAAQVMVGEGVAPLTATTEPNVTVAETIPTGEIAPRRGNVHDVERTVTHERIICRTVLRGSWQTAEAEGAV